MSKITDTFFQRKESAEDAEQVRANYRKTIDLSSINN